jgi:type 1 fimbria pilin
MDTVASLNEFKRIGGVVGQTMVAEETAVAGMPLRLLKGTSVVASGTTDADGFYLLNYKHTGKAANFTVQIVGSKLQQVVTLKANGYVQVDWDLATGAAKTEYGSGWTPK